VRGEIRDENGAGAGGNIKPIGVREEAGEKESGARGSASNILPI